MKRRIEELYQSYCDIFNRIDLTNIHSKERKKLEVKEPYKMKMFKDIKPKVVLPKVSQKIEKKM